jgi:hypothetical protein
MIKKVVPDSWQDLQVQVADILRKSGFSVEIEKDLATVRGSVEIDVYAIEDIDGREYRMLCECKYWKSNIPQQIIYGFRTVLDDTGANLGIIVTMSNFQTGALSSAGSTNIVLLNWEGFQERYFESWYSRHFYPMLSASAYIADDYNVIDFFDDLDREDRRLYFETRDQLDELQMVVGYFQSPIFKNLVHDYSISKLPINDSLFEDELDYNNLSKDFPKALLHETSYEAFLEIFIQFSKIPIEKFKYLKNKYLSEE